MKSTKRIELSTRELKSIIATAYQNATATAKRVSDTYIAFNPTDAGRRTRDLDLEYCGIENLYRKILKEIERIEKIG